MKESIVSLECWTLPKQTTKSDHLCKWSTVQHQVSHVFWNQLSRENAQNSGFCWVPSMCFIQGREVLQKQDYGLMYRLRWSSLILHFFSLLWLKRVLEVILQIHCTHIYILEILTWWQHVTTMLYILFQQMLKITRKWSPLKTTSHVGKSISYCHGKETCNKIKNELVETK